MMLPVYENLMSIEEMCRHEWDISWSGGKDSTAAIILMHNYGIPIDRIVYIRMMYDDTTPATLPIMTAFVDHAADVFRAWGYTVDIVKGMKTAHELASALFKNSIHKERNGKAYGMYAFFRGHCKFMSVKERTIHQVTDPNEYHMIGYTADEAHRLHRLSDKKQSILATLGYTEEDAKSLCSEYFLLSPLYGLGIKRDGCFFCPNAGKKERRIIHETVAGAKNIWLNIGSYVLIGYGKSLTEMGRDYLKACKGGVDSDDDPHMIGEKLMKEGKGIQTSYGYVFRKDCVIGSENPDRTDDGAIEE